MEKTYQTRNLVAADAGTTVTVRTKNANSNDGEVGYVTIFGDSAHVVTLYDGDPAAGGTVICVIPASTAAGTYWLKRPVKSGLFATVAASFAGNIVIGYN